jgi:hypothetical protein
MSRRFGGHGERSSRCVSVNQVDGNKVSSQSRMVNDSLADVQLPVDMLEFSGDVAWFCFGELFMLFAFSKGVRASSVLMTGGLQEDVLGLFA